MTMIVYRAPSAAAAAAPRPEDHTKRIAKLLAIATAMKKEARVRRHLFDYPYYTRGGTIRTPKVRSIADLHILAHECGHAAFRHTRRTPTWLAEFEAELWALAAFRRHDLVVSKTRIKKAKTNVRKELSCAWDFRPEQTAIKAAKWCGLGRSCITNLHND